jgi:hypothetical protein
VRNPINAGNRKVIVFTAFADTAAVPLRAPRALGQAELGIDAALVTGSGRNQTTLPHCASDLASILTAFSPRSKERPPNWPTRAKSTC